jgi:hypothetical protein
MQSSEKEEEDRRKFLRDVEDSDKKDIGPSVKENPVLPPPPPPMPPQKK